VTVGLQELIVTVCCDCRFKGTDRMRVFCDCRFTGFDRVRVCCDCRCTRTDCDGVL